MRTPLLKHTTRLAMVGSLMMAAAAVAGPSGHAGGGFHGGGFHGGGAYHVSGGFHGGYHAPGYGGHYYYGHGWYGHPYGGYGYRGYYPWYPWWGLGWYVPYLPLYYSTYWWGGVPYYYASNVYYVWDDAAAQYQAVDPPRELAEANRNGTAPPAPAGSSAPDLFAYPKGGQSQEQQARDREECRQWAAAQAQGNPAGGAAPGAPSAPSAPATANREDFLRAEAACLTARNYTVK
jgi:hypothetical protein